MGNTPRIKPVVTATTVEDDEDIELWDEFVNDAAPDVKPWRKRMPDKSVLAIPCPTSAQVTDLGNAQMLGNVPGMLRALIQDQARAEEIIELTEDAYFTVRVRLVNSVMLHYGMNLNALPE